MPRRKKTNDLTKSAFFIALILLLSVTPLSYISLGVISATTIQIPVIIGAVILGWKKGATFGAVFGTTSLILATIRPGPTSFVFSPFVPVFGEEKGSLAALLVCFVPRILIGVVAALLFKALSKTKLRKGMICSICGFCGSMTNTILVMGGIYLFFGKSYSAANSIAYETLITAVMATITGAGLTEALISAAVCGAVCAALFKYLQKGKD